LVLPSDGVADQDRPDVSAAWCTIRCMTGNATPPREDYEQVLGNLGRQVRSSRAAAVQAVNAEMLTLYRTIGLTLLDRQRHGWDEDHLDRLAAELRTAFPDMTGLSGNDLLHMQAFAEAWPDLSEAPAVQRLPWGHIRTLLDEVADPGVRDWYAAAAAEHGWSHDVLVNNIMSGSHLQTSQSAPAAAAHDGQA
jgi:hypothetical protein